MITTRVQVGCNIGMIGRVLAHKGSYKDRCSIWSLSLSKLVLFWWFGWTFTMKSSWIEMFGCEWISLIRNGFSWLPIVNSVILFLLRQVGYLWWCDQWLDFLLSNGSWISILVQDILCVGTLNCEQQFALALNIAKLSPGKLNSCLYVVAKTMWSRAIQIRQTRNNPIFFLWFSLLTTSTGKDKYFYCSKWFT